PARNASPVEPRRGAQWSDDRAAARSPNLQRQGRALELVVGLVHDLGHALDPVLQDALDARLERHGRRRTTHARTDEFDGDHAGRLVDVVQANVATIGLNSRSDGLDCLLDLLAHDVQSWFWEQRWSRARNRTFQRPGPRSDSRKLQLRSA